MFARLNAHFLRSLAAISATGALAIVVCGCSGVSGSSASPTAAACVPESLNVSAALAGSRVTVSPTPQSRDASATTQISFLGPAAGELSAVSVSGSRSGPHPGRLLPYTQGDGASFLPTTPFREGELVTVSAQLDREGQSIPFSWSFTVAHADTVHAAGAGTPVPPSKSSYYQHFLSRPDLEPPKVDFTTRVPGNEDGDIFLSPYSGPGQYGPMIINHAGQLIWFKPLPDHSRAADFRVQSYEGQPVLTWWQDPLVIDGQRTAGIVIDNSAYQQIATVAAGNGYQADLHEFQITPQGTAYLTIYNAIQCNLSSVGGPKDGAIADTIMQQIDVNTGLVMYEWHSVDHVALADSYSSAKPTSLQTPFDFFHINSVEPTREGQLLIDSRDTWALYDVSAVTGQVVWTLGGKHSSFHMGPGTKTAFQHDARLQSNGEITFFDNGASPKIHPQSRAIEERLDMQNMTVTLTRRYEHDPPLVAGSQGNMQALANGNWMVGWGQEPYFTEYSPSGAVLLDAHLPAGYENYRTFRFPWRGMPTVPPTLVLRSPTHGGQIAYASWNGSTQTASYRALEGATPTDLTASARSVKATGFQTQLTIGRSAKYVAVQALDAQGQVLATSKTVKA